MRLYHHSMLSHALVDQFQQDGFCAAERFLTREEVAGFLNSMERVCSGATVERHDASRVEMEPDQGREGSLVRRIYEPCTHYPEFRALSDSNKLLDSVAQLLGENVLFHYSKINMKPPEIGSVVEWHQDLAYYPLTNTDSLAVLFYLDDADRANGCLQVIPGVHRNGILNHSRDGFFRGQVTETVDASKAIALEGGAGTAIFLHGMTPHASAPNTSAHARRTLILGYRAADAYPIYAGETTVHAERHVRLVRGERSPRARFGMQDIPIPRYQDIPKSLYELQRRFREERG
ncbi:MAG: Mitomycin antibiotic biosynthesis protein [Bryobacterales bacterium]|nr:Mitomycin antibiotic biosynthesis protein [Bryobacterales bacterium]